MTGPVLAVSDLDVTYHVRSGGLPALRGVSFELFGGEILGVVGESGCGKSTLSGALLRLLPANGEISGGRVLLGGRDVTAMSDRELRALRGRRIAMIFQDPLTSLNPTFTVGAQLVAVQRAHHGDDAGTRVLRERAVEMLTRVGLPDADERIDYYPHQFSGGMRQRIMIAMALLLEPEVLIADEATSALDVTLQAQILELLRELRRERGTAMLFISHDIGVISEICDRLVVMYAGRAVEHGAVRDVLSDPKHPYTRALLASVPTKDRRGERLATIPGRVPSLSELPAGCGFADRCPHAQPVCRDPGPTAVALPDRTVRCLVHDPSSAYDRAATTAPGAGADAPAELARPDDDRRTIGDVLVAARGVEVHFRDRPTIATRLLRRPLGAVRAVDGVDLAIRRGEIVGLVGESGSGKTTLGKALLGLVPATGGSITYDGADLTGLGQRELRGLRRHIQMIFQDAHASLSPRRRVGQLLTDPYEIHDVPAQERIPVAELLELVQLAPEQATKYPHELSGGQARRVNIARALALRPEFIVADEPSAGLDVSAAASVLNLMKDLANELGLTYLIVTHDLNLVGYIADRIALMYLGRLVEVGPTADIFDRPRHPYTQGLLDAVATPDPDETTAPHRLLLPGEIPSPKNPPPGCRFHTRCRYARRDSCLDMPELRPIAGEHAVTCHHWEEIGADPDAAAAKASPDLAAYAQEPSG